MKVTDVTISGRFKLVRGSPFDPSDRGSMLPSIIRARCRKNTEWPGRGQGEVSKEVRWE